MLTRYPIVSRARSAHAVRTTGLVLTRCSIAAFFLLYNLFFLGIVVVIASASSSGFVALRNVSVGWEREAC